MLTDNNQYKSQLYIKLYPKENSIEIKMPINVGVAERLHPETAFSEMQGAKREEFRIIHSMRVVLGTVWCVDWMTNVPYLKT